MISVDQATTLVNSGYNNLNDYNFNILYTLVKRHFEVSDALIPVSIKSGPVLEPLPSIEDVQNLVNSVFGVFGDSEYMDLMDLVSQDYDVTADGFISPKGSIAASASASAAAATATAGSPPAVNNAQKSMIPMVLAAAAVYFLFFHRR